MEDYALDIIIGKGPSANSIRLDLPKFGPDRCHHPGGIAVPRPAGSASALPLRLELYTPEELTKIVTRSAGILNVPIEGGRRPGDCPPLQRYSPYCQPNASACAGFCAGHGKRRRHPGGRRSGA